MMQPNSTLFRILVVNDDVAVHEDFRKILQVHPEQDPALDNAEAPLIAAPRLRQATTTFQLDFTSGGKEALEKVVAAVTDGKPYALAFVDIRMPSGGDGVETITRLWKADPALQCIICTAYSDSSSETISERLSGRDNLVILKKPFDKLEVQQIAYAITKKWQLTKEAHMRMEVLELMVEERTRALQHANAELRRSEQQFATAFRASPAPMAIQSVKGRFVDVNEAFLHMTGFTAKELLGQTAGEAQLNIEYAGAAPLQTPSKSVRNLGAQIRTKSGEIKQALVSSECITLSEEPHLLLLVQDISERLQLEEQLRQAHKMEAIGQLAAGVAHDFNNLLTVIQGHSSLHLASSDLTPELKASLQQVEHAANRAAELTRQLLAFSRRQIIRLRVISLSDHLDRLGAVLRRLIDEKVELHCDVPPKLELVCADPTSIDQVIINLVVNARDAMPEGGRITIAAKAVTVDLEYCRNNPDALPGEFICISVTDTGSGMDESTRSRIFEPFFTTKEVNKGMGMGLATVYGIIRQHEGWVEVTTGVGLGSTFRIYLPICEGEVEEKPTPILHNGKPPRSYTILVVEDDEAVRALVKEVLVQHDYQVLEAENADAALNVWASHRNEVELLLTDMVMPGSANGLELAQRILADKPDLKVIYTSGYSSDLFSSNIELRDGINYLPKPYLSSKLTSMILNALAPESAVSNQS